MATANAPKKPSGVNGSIRFCFSLLIAISVGIFVLFWEGGFVGAHGLPPWMGTVVFAPLIAVVLAFCGNSLVQQLSCGHVDWWSQLQRVTIVPVPYLVLWVLLYFIPILRWPIEGLVQNTTPLIRHGLSSAFYYFWATLYTESVLIGLSQICPT
jgi:hypothetical protein